MVVEMTQETIGQIYQQKSSQTGKKLGRVGQSVSPSWAQDRDVNIEGDF